MAWYAKPSGGYYMNGAEGTANILEMAAYFRTQGYTDQAIAAICGNAYAESALNPWRWQGDSVSLSGGYGLFQFTPASGYINTQQGVQDYSPNMSVSTQTAGATPEDGIAQCRVFAGDTLSKWVSYCWRDYWSTTTFASLYAYRSQVLNTWGNGSRLYQSDFKSITDIRAATFAFLACYEGPASPSGFETRVGYANDAYTIISGAPPAPSGIPVWLLFKWREDNIKHG